MRNCTLKEHDQEVPGTPLRGGSIHSYGRAGATDAVMATITTKAVPAAVADIDAPGRRRTRASLDQGQHRFAAVVSALRSVWSGVAFRNGLPDRQPSPGTIGICSTGRSAPLDRASAYGTRTAAISAAASRPCTLVVCRGCAAPGCAGDLDRVRDEGRLHRGAGELGVRRRAGDRRTAGRAGVAVRPAAA
jgi:hypothetical protein